MFVRVQLSVKVKPEPGRDAIIVDPPNLLQQQQPICSTAQHQQPTSAPHHKPTSSSTTSAMTGSTDVTWRHHGVSAQQQQQQQLRAIQHQMLLMQGLPAVIPTTISQSGCTCSFYIRLPPQAVKTTGRPQHASQFCPSTGVACSRTLPKRPCGCGRGSPPPAIEIRFGGVAPSPPSKFVKF